MVSINCTTEDHLELDQLTEFQGGLKNRTDGDYAKIIVSIQKYGFSFPFFVWSHDGINHVLDGHGRLGALKKLKDQGDVIPPLPVVYVDCGTEENAKNLLLRLNSQYGSMTAESVMDFMDGFDFDPFEIALPSGTLDLNLDATASLDDDDTPDPVLDAPAISKPGEVYILGDHRLMCGDSTDRECFEKLMDGNIADISFTSPPYAIGDNNLRGHREKGHSDHFDIYKTHDDDIDVWDTLIEKSWQMMSEFSRQQFINIQFLAENKRKLMMWVAGHIDSLCDIIIWDKVRSANQIVKNILNTVFEFIFVFGDGTRKMMFGDFHGTESNIIHIDHGRNEYADVHKAVFTIELPIKILNLNRKAESVLDPFGGTGTTMIAAQKTGKTCYMMEIDPIYCDVIRRRWTNWCKENGVEPGEGKLE